MNGLDDLLARSAPPAAEQGTALNAAIASLVGETQSTAMRPHRQRPPRRWVIASAVAAGVFIAGGTAYGAATLTDDSPAWMNPTEDAESAATRFEWQTTLPDGTRCVERLTGVDLSEDQIATITDALSNPERLIALDDGAVREEFLADYDSSADKQRIADRETWASWIDAAYDAVAAIDLKAGRGGLAEDALGVVPGGAQNEVFLRASMTAVLDGITAQGVDALATVTPETACEATQ
ncbi:MAG: hypothetical protein ACK5IM_05730 [Demequina sp.]|uniref:hypothetical protein n=1 Tax=Demequina sp. TaxID=2050685 RepID=UPI003A8C46FF